MKTRLTFFLWLVMGCASSIHAATIYVDPDCANNGDGTAGSPCASSGGAAGPFNTWTGMSYSAGNTYAQKAGTTFTNAAGASGTINIATSGASAASQITLTRYGEGDDPKIDGTGSNFGIRLNGARSFITIDNFEIYGTTSSGSNNWGIQLCNETFECSSITVSNVTIHDPIDPGVGFEANGIWGYCADCTFDNLLIYNIPSDGFWLSNVGNFTLTNSYIYNVATDGRGLGDGVQLEGTGGSLTITDNIIDHRSVASKQALNDSTTTGTSGLIARNEFYMSTTGAFKNVFLMTENLIIHSNKFIGGWRCLDYGKSGYIIGNLIAGCYNIGFIPENGTDRVQYFLNNTVDGLNDRQAKADYCVFSVDDGATTIYFYNNIFTNCGAGVVPDASGTFTNANNLFYNNTTNAGANFTVHGSSILANPLYVNMADGGDFRTRSSSPARRAGIEGYPCKDVRDRPCYPDSPDIGAYQASGGDPANTRIAR